MMSESLKSRDKQVFQQRQTCKHFYMSKFNLSKVKLNQVSLQADICHAYQILSKHGIPDERIIVMMYDDIAYNDA